MSDLKKIIKSLHKGELHIHLNGLVPTKIVKKILEEEKIRIPEGFCLDRDLVVTTPANSLNSYLKPWNVLRLIPNSKRNLDLMVKGAFQNLNESNIKFAEIRNSIIYIAHLNKIKISEAMKWVIESLTLNSEKYHIQSGLILTISRGDYVLDHLRTLLEAYIELGKPKQVIGLDLAGNENIEIPEDIAFEFRKAKEIYGLKLTIHAGETGNFGNIEEAINSFGADRIGHGTAASKSLKVMELLREKDVCVEVCPKSNRLTDAVREEESHPVVSFLKYDVPFVICSDNPAIHMSTINEDYEQFVNETGAISTLKKMYLLQKKYSFLGIDHVE